MLTFLKPNIHNTDWSPYISLTNKRRNKIKDESILFWVNFLLILLALYPDEARMLLRECSCSLLLGEKSKRHFPSSFPLITPYMERTTCDQKNRPTNPKTDGVVDRQTDEQADERTDKPTEY